MKQKEFKKDIFAIIFYIFTFIIIYLVLTSHNHLFASNIDFRIQHYIIPDYFRELFYSTKDLFPDFAFNLGSGQNIYYLSYYGFLNPIILISYLFPKVKMLDYIIISSSIIVITSTILFYYFLKQNNYNYKTRFITTFLFLCATPLIFHAKRHIMFINYFPFLITALIGIDKYFKNKNILHLSLSIALVIYTSYFYSISCLFTLFIYFIYKCLKSNKKIIKETLKISIPVLEGILISSIIIFPTLYCLLNGRNTTSNNINILDLIKPKTYLLYSSYTIGLTLICLISLIIMSFNKKKENKFLARTIIIISTIPIFNYILNGTLYTNGKSLIPLIPLALISTSEFLQTIFKEKITKKQLLLIAYILISSFSICLIANLQDQLMTKNDINNSETKTTKELINYITKEDTNLYRINNLVSPKDNINQVTNINEYKATLYSSTSNKNYKDFYYKTLNNNKQYRNDFMISSSDNILSQSTLGEKYIITNNPLESNYELIKEKNGIYLYKNNNALPIAYATTNIIDTKTFKSLTYPSNTVALLNNIIVDNPIIPTNKKISQIQETKIDYEIIEQNNLEYKNINNKTIITAQDNTHLKLKLKTNPKNKIILIKFTHNQNPNYDLSITINNEKNTLTSNNWKYKNNNLTFNYYIYNTNILDIYIKKGTYILKDFETYILDYSEINKKDIQELTINKNKTKGDKIVGTINIKEESYFNLSIPYDKGFKILLDNKPINYEKTNTNFIGFPITKGNHNISIEYIAPYKNISIIISLISSIALIITQIIYKKILHK